ncbi:hypothetical protein sS8_2578 [Methylocaldum marinum]|uniref:Uncharacterized protein n=1 Tax=Methylocaldum marinum TaxID=1432792 RepID=A0A250KXP2_9GAMM|nr:hypothetical protein sS8_2578 [Methylocaldum marinum]
MKPIGIDPRLATTAADRHIRPGCSDIAREVFADRLIPFGIRVNINRRMGRAKRNPSMAD